VLIGAISERHDYLKRGLLSLFGSSKTQDSRREQRVVLSSLFFLLIRFRALVEHTACSEMSAYEIVKTVELSSMPNPALAKDLLERLRLATKVVVAKRKWRVSVLKEFYPKNGSLLGLNVNGGQSIMIRLREARDQFTFLPWHSLLGTLVHELTHNEIGAHSAEFYKMMETVYDEVEASSGSTGSLWGPKVPQAPKYNFDGPSAKLGGGQLARKVGTSKEDVRKLAAEAALRRIEGGGNNAGGHILGGSEITATKSRKQLFLEAEERRRQDHDGCSVVKAPKDIMNAPVAQDTSSDVRRGVPSSSSSSSSSSSNYQGRAPPTVNDKSDSQWLCQVCMEQNTSAAAVCAWCGCVFGSTLDDGSQLQSAGTGQDTALVGGSFGLGNSGRQSDNQIALTYPDVDETDVLLAGLCRNTLYEVRGCACCGNRQPQFLGTVRTTNERKVGRERIVKGEGGLERGVEVISLIDESTEPRQLPRTVEGSVERGAKRRRRENAVKKEGSANTGVGDTHKAGGDGGDADDGALLTQRLPDSPDVVVLD
jgi:hypothetical protein